MYYTAQEMMAQIKGWEYVIAILFLLMFMAFWRVANLQRKRRLSRSLVLARQALASSQSGKKSGKSTAFVAGAQRQACWEIKQCPPEARDECASYLLRPLPCWVARGFAEGKKWEPCSSCQVYSQALDHLVAVYSNGGRGSNKGASAA